MKSLPLRFLSVVTLSLPPFLPVRAEKQSISRDQAEALVSGLKFQQGEITLDDGLATLRVPEAFRF